MFGTMAYLPPSTRERMWGSGPATPPVAPPAPPAPPSEPDLVAQLRELKALLDSGALTPQEFDAFKRKLLSTT